MKVEIKEHVYLKGTHYYEGDTLEVGDRLGGAWIQTGKAMKYFAKRAFAHPTENRLTKAGERIDVSKGDAKDMENKGLITPAYKTKEDKDATRVYKKSSDLTLSQIEEYLATGKTLDFSDDDRKGVEQYK